jgi:hypothetical protein
MNWLKRILFGSIRSALPAIALVAKAVVAAEIAEENWPEPRKAAALAAAHRAIELFITELESRLGG